MAEIKLIVGLGNPGLEYALTRHNVGFWVLDKITRKFGGVFKQDKKFFGEINRINFNNKNIILLKPTTFMNLSGQAVYAVMCYFQIKSKEILVIHDELDLQAGCVKVKQGGGCAGHNGLKDIDSKLDSNDYYRIRVGIGRPNDKIATLIQLSNQILKQRVISQHVLSQPSAEDQEKIEHGIEAIIANWQLIVNMDLEIVQQKLHDL